MIHKHIQDLCNEIQSDPTLTGLQEEVERLDNCIDSLSVPVTNWGDIDATNTFKDLNSSTILCNIVKLKCHSKKCHCINEIAELCKTLELKIAKIPVRSYKDEVTALNTQLDVLADQVNVHHTRFGTSNYRDEITRLQQDLDCQIAIVNTHVLGSTTGNIHATMQNLKDTFDPIKKNLEDTEN